MPPEELCERALQAQEKGIKPENYEGRYNEYLREIETIDLEPETRYSPEEKNEAAAQVLGLALVEHYGKDSGADKFLSTELTEANRNFYRPERVISYMDTFKNSSENMENINKYFDSKLDSLQDIRKTESVLLEAEKSLNVGESKTKSDFDAERVKRWQESKNL